MKLNFPNLVDTRSFARPSPGAKNTNEPGQTPATLKDTVSNQLQRLQDGLQRLNAAPSFRYNAKPAAAEKAGMLRQRLEMLKVLLLHASPKAAKAIARELKGIAGELAALAHSAGGGTSNIRISTDTPPTPNVSSAQTTPATPAEATASDPESAAETEPQGDTGSTGASAKTTDKSDSSPQKTSSETASGNSVEHNSDDHQLRAVLLDAKKLLKEVIDLLKAKIKAGDKEARHDVEAAEKSLAQLSSDLSQGSVNNLYTASGLAEISATDTGLTAPAASSGGNVDVSA